MSRQWRGSVTWRQQQTPTDQQLEQLAHALPGYSTAVHDGERATLTARMSVTAPTLRSATDEVLKAARAAHHGAFAATADPIDIRVLTDEAWTDELETPAPLDLVGNYEAAQILGVSTQRVGQLADDHPGFPRPVATLRAGRIYTRASIDAFAASDWRRRPGPKPKADDPAH